MALPAWSFILVGLIVTSISSYVGSKLQIFFYVGLAFLTWGIFRSLTHYMLKSAKPVEEKKIERKLEQTSIMACPYCATAVYTTAKFCHNCGGRLLRA